MSKSSNEKHPLMINAYSIKGITTLRQRFFKKIRQDILQWGEESLDTARTYYPPQSMPNLNDQVIGLKQLQMVEDRMYIPKARSYGPDFITDIDSEWWPSRTQVSDDQDEKINRKALCGFYGKYLPSSGFALVLEFHNTHEFLNAETTKNITINQDHQGLVHIWRVDAREKGVALKQVEFEGDFYDQFGTYLDLHCGWRWLIEQHLQSKAMMIAEVAPGYMIGVRAGDPNSDEHPAEREDRQIEEVFSRFDAERFDSLEFLNDQESESLPFSAERYHEWLPAEYSEVLDRGDIELFTLSQAESFYQTIEELAERRKVEIEWVKNESSPEDYLLFTRGPLSIQHNFAYAYLWSLHTGRFWHQTAQELFTHDLEVLYSASTLYFQILRVLDDEDVCIEEGNTLVIRGTHDKEYVRVPLLQWAGQGAFDHNEGAVQFLQMFGYDQGSWQTVQRRLDTCPVCGDGARIIKALRPNQHTQSLQHVTTFKQEHLLGYYALNCPTHSIPIDWAKSSQIELALQHQSHHMIDIKAEKMMGGCKLLWAREIAGDILSEEIQVHLREDEYQYAYAFYPDVVALSSTPLQDDWLDSMRVYADHMARQWGAHRMWPLNYHLILQDQSSVKH